MQNRFHTNWTVIILVYAQVTKDEKNETDISILEQVKEFFFQIQISELNGYTDIFIISNEVKLTATEKVSDETKIFKVIKGTPNSFSQIGETIQEKNTFQKKATLSHLFKQIQPKIPHHNKIMIITWDHGSVFGIFKRFSDQSISQVPGKKIKATLSHNFTSTKCFVQNKPYKIESSSNKTLNISNFIDSKDADSDNYIDMLTSDELGMIIKDGLKRKVEVILMMNCWMQNLHTMHALYKRTEYLIAPEGLITSFTYDYQNLIENLSKCSSGHEVCKNISSNLIAEYQFKTEKLKTFKLENDLDTVSIFYTNLGNFTNFLGVLKKSIEQLKLSVTSDTNSHIVKAIYDSRRRVFVFDIAAGPEFIFKYFMIDFITFLVELSELDNSNPEIYNSVKPVNSLYAIKPTIGKYPYTIFSNSGNINQSNSTATPTGTGIFFPDSIKSYSSSFYVNHLKKTNKISFYNPKITFWLKFLKLYYADLKKLKIV